MKKQFSLMPLVLAISACFAAVTHAETNHLGTLDATIDRQGSKVKTNVVTTAMQNQSTETDLRGLLSEEPAIAIGGGNGTSQFYYIRGMGQNSIDVKVDDAYADSQIHYHQGRFMLDPSLVKIVSVQKGAGSASAGIGATNGALVAKTLDASDLLKDNSKPFGVKLKAGYNSNNGHNHSIAAFGKTGNFDLLATFNRIKDNNYVGGRGYKNLLGSNEVTYSALDKFSYLLKGGVNFDNHRLSISYLNEQHEGDRPVREEFDFANVPLTTTGNLTDEQKAMGYKTDTDGKTILDANGNRVPNLARNVGSQKQMRQTIANLEWTAHDLNFAESAKGNIYRMTTTRRAANDSNNGYAGNIAGTTNMGITTYGANINFDTGLSDTILVKYGVNYRHQEVSPAKFFSTRKEKDKEVANPSLNNQQKHDVGVYAEAISQMGDATLTTGLRLDHFKFTAMDGRTATGSDVNPSIGLIYQVSPALSLNTNLSYASRSPRLYDAITAGGNRGVVTIDENVRAEKARNSEIGFNYTDGNFAANGSYYWQRIDNALGNFASARHGGNKAIQNSGYMTNQGYEVGASYRYKGLLVRAGVADSNPQMFGEKLSENPEFATAIGRTWTGSVAYRFDTPNLEVGVKNRTVQGVNAVLLQGKSPQNKDGYSVSDVFANWKPFNDDSLNVNFAIDNVLDTNYRPHAQRPTVNTLAGAGRDYRIGINYTY